MSNKNEYYKEAFEKICKKLDISYSIKEKKGNPTWVYFHSSNGVSCEFFYRDDSGLVYANYVINGEELDLQLHIEEDEAELVRRISQILEIDNDLEEVS